jgi:hypothetical protein
MGLIDQHLFPHAHAEEYRPGRWRVVLADRHGRQEILRRDLSREEAERIAATMNRRD